jgi:hypothetical protein
MERKPGSHYAGCSAFAVESHRTNVIESAAPVAVRLLSRDDSFITLTPRDEPNDPQTDDRSSAHGGTQFEGINARPSVCHLIAQSS